MDFHKDYYKILGIEQTASETEIKLAYRRLAVRYHPDRNPGKPEYEELTKELNEAKEVLLNTEKRFAYDEYRRMEQAIFNEQAKKTEDPQPQPKDTTAKEPKTRTRTVVNELRIYITGTISIKYYAPQDMERFDPSLRESYYQINPTANTATINIKDCIWSEAHPVNFAQIFDQYPIFPGRILQPVTTLVKDGETSQHYELFIRELRIPDPSVVLVTKHENSSYGTIEGVFYGYVRDFEAHQVTEIIEEKEKKTESPPFRYAGPTGRKGEKYQRGWYWRRDEYYYPNGSTFWGSWYNTRAGGGDNFVATTPTSGGCAGSGLGILVWAFVLLWMIIRAPYILPVIGLYFLLFLIGQLFTGRRGGSIIGGIIFLLYLLGLIGLLMQDHRLTKRRSDTPPVQTESVRDSREPSPPRRQPLADTSSAHHEPDTLVTRSRQWTDYSGRIFAGNYTYRTSWLRAAMRFKKDIPYTDKSPREYDRIIHAIKENDAPHMSGVYSLFDSLRTAGNLSQTEFAEMVVSFVQDIPYGVVLDDECDPSLYHDAFISKYLSTPDAICAPHQRFGIYSPLEFVANENGDCDTRTLFSYLVLSHYGYGVVLLSSEVYRHSMIGINLPYAGKVYEYGHDRYVVWETTAKHARPGVLPPEISNMAAWRISLLNQP